MATRSNIAKVLPDGKVRVIYSHWDGYPDHHWPILTEHYNTEDKVDALLDLGDVSVLGEEIGEKQDFDNGPVPHTCLAYGRDRGEPGTEAVIVDSLQEAAQNEYLYWWENGEWHCDDEEAVADLKEGN
jgi:hypothetical protein